MQACTMPAQVPGKPAWAMPTTPPKLRCSAAALQNTTPPYILPAATTSIEDNTTHHQSQMQGWSDSAWFPWSAAIVHNTTAMQHSKTQASHLTHPASTAAQLTHNTPLDANLLITAAAAAAPSGSTPSGPAYHHATVATPPPCTTHALGVLL
jgi:hypothetical protein